MMTAAASAICDAATIHDDAHGMLLPDRADLAETATAVARTVARAAVADGVAPRLTGAQIDDAVQRTRWQASYR
jgi:malate dehydrogenase (oxaloacetate-decarboxylating)